MTRRAELPDAVVRYAAHDDGLIDLHLPAAPGPHPLVVYVHGGFWRRAFDRTHARPLAEALAREGFAVALPEYRRGPSAWPDTSADLTAVMDRLPELLARIGVATTSTTLVGHSAGGHLVLWLANQPHVVRRVVALAPVGDLRFAAETGMGDEAATEFFGGTPGDDADPGVRLQQRPPTDVVVVHGDDDAAVDVESSRGLARRFDWIDYRELAGVDHLDVIDPLSGAWPTVLASVRGETLEA